MGYNVIGGGTVKKKCNPSQLLRKAGKGWFQYGSKEMGASEEEELTQDYVKCRDILSAVVNLKTVQILNTNTSNSLFINHPTAGRHVNGPTEWC